jgi:hypothetical protein
MLSEAGVRYWKLPPLPDCEPTVTVAENVPVALAGVEQVNEVELLTLTEVQFPPLMVTLVEPLMKLVPVIVTVVPPVVGPELGEMLETVGAPT